MINVSWPACVKPQNKKKAGYGEVELSREKTNIALSLALGHKTKKLSLSLALDHRPAEGLPSSSIITNFHACIVNPF